MENKRQLRGASRFQEGEVALCYEPDPSKAKMLYEAKILEMETTKDAKGKRIMEYFVHFIGWNKNWDRWVPDDSILKDSEVNRELQRNLIISNSKSKNSRNRRTSDLFDGSSPTHSIDSSVPENEVIKVDPVVVDPPPENKVVSLEIPFCLKQKLEEDCYKIKRKKLLVTLPRSPCARDILDDFVKQMENDKTHSRNLIEEFVEGMMTYFNFTIGTLLLYNYEKEQYKTLFPPQVSVNVKQEPLSPVAKNSNQDDGTHMPRPKRRKRSSTSTSSDCGKEGNEGKTESKRRSLRPRTSLVFYTWDKYGTGNIGSSHVNEPAGQENNPENTALEEETVSKPVRPSPTETDGANITSVPSYMGTTKSPIEVYGAEHLSRLFACAQTLGVFLERVDRGLVFVLTLLLMTKVRLPSLIARTHMEDEKLKVLLDFLKDFMAFISERSSQYFDSNVYKEIEPM